MTSAINPLAMYRIKDIYDENYAIVADVNTAKEIQYWMQEYINDTDGECMLVLLTSSATELGVFNNRTTVPLLTTSINHIKDVMSQSHRRAYAIRG